jgi:hypothetical protein
VPTDIKAMPLTPKLRCACNRLTQLHLYQPRKDEVYGAVGLGLFLLLCTGVRFRALA